MIITNRPVKHYQLQTPTTATRTYACSLSPTHTFCFEQLSAGLHPSSKSHRDAPRNTSLDFSSVGGQLVGGESVLPLTPSPPSFNVLSATALLLFVLSYHVVFPDLSGDANSCKQPWEKTPSTFASVSLTQARMSQSALCPHTTDDQSSKKHTGWRLV